MHPHRTPPLLPHARSGRAGAADMDELKGHAFFAGVDWQGLRQQTAPACVAPRQQDATAIALDWELTSLAGAAGGPLAVEYLPPQGTAA